jgi:hypothetical protein
MAEKYPSAQLEHHVAPAAEYWPEGTKEELSGGYQLVGHGC